MHQLFSLRTGVGWPSLQRHNVTIARRVIEYTIYPKETFFGIINLSLPRCIWIAAGKMTCWTTEYVVRVANYQV